MNIQILIPSLIKRKLSFDALMDNLINQRVQLGLTAQQIDIKPWIDEGELSVGYKRQGLVQQCNYDYFCFIDDDDWISDKYLSLIYDAAQQGTDCASLTGIITFSGINPRTFIHSLKYDSYFEENEIYYRPPNHLNLIKTKIGKQIKFPDKNCGEDTDWAMDLCKSKLLKTETVINDVLYYYKYDSNNTETQK